MHVNRISSLILVLGILTSAATSEEARSRRIKKFLKLENRNIMQYNEKFTPKTKLHTNRKLNIFESNSRRKLLTFKRLIRSSNVREVSRIPVTIVSRHTNGNTPLIRALYISRHGVVAGRQYLDILTNGNPSQAVFDLVTWSNGLYSLYYNDRRTRLGGFIVADKVHSTLEKCDSIEVVECVEIIGTSVTRSPYFKLEKQKRGFLYRHALKFKFNNRFMYIQLVEATGQVKLRSTVNSHTKFMLNVAIGVK